VWLTTFQCCCWLRGVVVIDDVAGKVTLVPIFIFYERTCNPGTLRVGQGAAVASLYGPAVAMRHARHAALVTQDSQ